MPRPGDVDATYADKILAIGLEIVEPFKGAKIHHMLRCCTCSHQWIATPISKLQSNKKYGGNGCPQCTTIKKENAYAVIREEKICTLTSRGITILSEYDGRLRLNYTGKMRDERVRVRNENCGHEFDVNPSNLINGVQCPVCNTDTKRTRLKATVDRRRAEYVKTADTWTLYKSEVYSITRNSYKKYHKIINPKKYKTGKAGVEGAYHLDHIVPVRYCFDNGIPAKVCGHPQNLQMLPWEANLQQKDKLKKSIPPIFYKFVPPSLVEANFVNTLSHIPMSETYSDILDPYTVSVWFPQADCAVLFCPLSEYVEQKAQDRAHINRILRLANSKNIKCLVVYEDEWFFNKDIVYNKILHIIKQTTVPVIYARNCMVQEVKDIPTKTKFLDQYHIQGADRSIITLGAYYNNELIGIMTFNKPRLGMGATSNIEAGTWELSRFATNSKYRIPGIAGKLLKYFTRIYEWNTIYSFADRRWSSGNLYQRLGFIETSINPPDYYYIVDGKRVHRWNYRKDVIQDTLPIYDHNLTEYENMINNGFDRIWGAGTIRYEIKKPA